MLNHLVCLVALSYVAVQQPAEESAIPDQETAIARIQSLGGRATATRISVFRGEIDDNTLRLLAAFPELESLSLYRANITDAGLVHIQQLKKLRSLSLSQAPITNKGVEAIAALTNLEDLQLNATRIADEGLAKLKPLRKLKSLQIAGSQITNDGLLHLQHFPNLEQLGLGLRGNITDDGLRHLQHVATLKRLQLSSDFTDAGMPHVAALANLESLAILNCPRVTDAGMESLKGGLTKLERLSLNDLNVTDASMPSVANFTELRSLSIQSRSISDKGFAKLSALKKVESMQLWYLSITDAALDTLKDMNRIQMLTLVGLDISDTGLEKLQHLKRLNRLTILGCGVTTGGIDGLKKTIPALQVHAQRLQYSPIRGRMTERNGPAKLSKEQEQTIAKLVAEGSRVSQGPNGEIHSITIRRDDLIKYLNQLPQLDLVLLRGSDVTDAGIAELVDMKNLTRLSLSDTLVTDVGLGELRKLPELELLFIHGNHVFSSADLKQLKTLPKLRMLALHAPPADNDLGFLTELSQITILTLDGIPIGQREVDVINQLTSLRRLSLKVGPISDDDLQWIGKIKIEMDLTVSNSPEVGDTAWMHLAGAPVTKLQIGGVRLTDRSLAHFGTLPRLESLRIRESPITDDGLTHLKRLKVLRFLSFQDTLVTNPGLTDLMDSLPNLRYVTNNRMRLGP